MKTALIIGGTSGIGLSIAKDLLQKNYSVKIVGSNETKGVAIAATLELKFPGRVTFFLLDLSNLKQVTAFTKQFLEEHSSLDLLANIAGVMEPKRKLTPEGFEKTFTVGYLSAYILSTELAPLLEKSPYGRIVNVAGVPSFVFKAQLDFNDLSFSKNYSSFKTAITTIHAKTVLTEILSEEYAAKKIDVNSFHPGAIQSDLMKTMSMFGRAVFSVLSLFMSKSCKTGIYVSTSEDIQGVTGKFFVKKRATPLAFKKDYKDQLLKETKLLLEGLDYNS